jgi:dTDP-4-dehydrorhamnose reductase
VYARGNGRHRYADVEAVRVRAEGLAGAGALLREAWERYRCPVAITEAHLGCTSDEQVRWLVEVWNEARVQEAGGVDVRAVTVWSLLGAYDWDSLVTCRAGHYEPGVFDLRGSEPRPTALASVVQDLAAGRPPRHAALDGRGWWRRPERLTFPEPVRRRLSPAAAKAADTPAGRHQTCMWEPLRRTSTM